MSGTRRLKPRVGVGALSSPLEVGANRAPGAAAELAAALEARGCDVVGLGPIGSAAAAAAAGRLASESHLDAVALAVASWFEDYLVLDFLEECAAPLLLRPLPGMETGALCGTQQLTAYLRQLDVPFLSVFGAAADPGVRAGEDVFLRGAAVRGRLRRCRIGLAGNHINGMTHTAPNEVALKRVIGPRVVLLDLPRLLETALNLPDEQAKETWDLIRSRAGSCEIDDEAGLDSARMCAAMRDVVDDKGLNALTIGCYPDLMGRVCLAASVLADDGVPLACEGDVHGAVGQFILQQLTGQPTHNTDWLDPVDEHSVVFTHCGSGSFSLAARPAEIRLASVRLMGRGACALFTAKPGPVTLVNITPDRGGYQCALLEGVAEPTEMVFPGNPVRVRFASPVADLIPWIHEAGLGHHWMIGYGHVGAEVRIWAKLAGQGLRLVEPSGKNG